jgi:hypothetical protein
MSTIGREKKKLIPGSVESRLNKASEGIGIDEKKIKAILKMTGSVTVEEAVRKLNELAGARTPGEPGSGSDAEPAGGQTASKPVELAMGEPSDAGGPRRDGPGHTAVAERRPADAAWTDVLAGRSPGLLGGLSAGDVPMKSIDEQPMRGSDYVPPEKRPQPVLERPDKAGLEAAAALEAARDQHQRPEFADMSAGPATGQHVAVRFDAIVPTVGLEPTHRDEIAAYQAGLGDEWRRWRGAGLGQGVVDPKLAAKGLASAGGSADRAWLDVMAGQPPGLLGGHSAGELHLKPVLAGAREQRQDVLGEPETHHREDPRAQDHRAAQQAVMEMSQRLGLGIRAGEEADRVADAALANFQKGLDRQTAVFTAVVQRMQAMNAAIERYASMMAAQNQHLQMMSAGGFPRSPSMASSSFP